MTIRKGENDDNFIKKLKNPPKPINDTSTSAEMEEYLDDLNNDRLKKVKKVVTEKEQHYKLFCPSCRRPTLKRTPQLTYRCSFCGLGTTAPLRMAVE